MDRLEKGVEGLDTVIGSVEQLVANISQELKSIKAEGDTPDYDTAKVDALTARLDGYSERLAAMVAVNTEAEAEVEEVPEADVPAEEPKAEETPETGATGDFQNE